MDYITLYEKRITSLNDFLNRMLDYSKDKDTFRSTYVCLMMGSQKVSFLSMEQSTNETQWFVNVFDYKVANVHSI